MNVNMSQEVPQSTNTGKSQPFVSKNQFIKVGAKDCMTGLFFSSGDLGLYLLLSYFMSESFGFFFENRQV